MKRILFSFFILLASLQTVYCQIVAEPDTSILDSSLQVLTVDEYKAALKLYQPRILKASPEVAGLQQIGHSPVNYYNGKANIGLALLTLASKEPIHNVNLSYDAGGIKVEQEATQVGLGWNLNAGFSITRNIRGRDDFDGLLRFSDNNQAYLNSMRAPSYIFNIPSDINWSFDHIVGGELFTNLALFCNKNYAPSLVKPTAVLMAPIPAAIEAGKPRLDGESDVFSFNAGTYSGKFIIVPTSFSYEILTLDASPIKIELLPIMVPDLTGNAGFRITTPDGVKYNFTVTEKNISRSATSFSGRIEYPEIQNSSNTDNALASIGWDLENINAATPTITAWNISTVTSPTDPNDLLSFVYTTDSDYSAIALPTRVNNLTHNTLLWRITDNRQKQVLLTQIISSKGKITFTRSLRDDVRGNLALKLDKVTLFDHNDVQVKGFNFNYSYFDSGDNTKPDFVRKRLKLESVVEFGNDNSQLPPTIFDYANTVIRFGSPTVTPLPNKNSYAQDYFGFFNGEDANDTKVNSAQGTGTTGVNTGNMVAVNLPSAAIRAGWGFDNPAIRTVNAQYAQLGTLNKITYPTGGFTVYEYESNTINNATFSSIIPSFTVDNFSINTALQGAGLRLKRSTIFESPSTVNLKRAYTYGSVSSASMKLMYDMDFSHIINNGTGTPFQTFSSLPQTAFSYGAMGQPVGYSTVRESDLDLINIANGYTDYEFENNIEIRRASFCFPTLTPGTGEVILPVCSVNISSASATCTYTLTPNGNGIVYDKVLLENASIPNEYDGMNGLLKTKTLYDAAFNPVMKEENFYTIKSTQKIRNLSATSRTETDPFPALWTYFNTIEWIALDHKTTTQYFTVGNISNTETYTYNSINQQVASVAMLGSDAELNTTYIKYPADLPSATSTALISQNRVNEVLEAWSENTTQNKILSKIKNTYTIFGSKILQTAARELRTGVDDGIDDLQLFYDAESNVKRIVSRSAPETHYLYAYNGKYPVAEIKGCTEAELNAALSSAGSTYDDIFALNTDASIKTIINSLRVALGTVRTNIMLTGFTHKPLVNINYASSPNGLETTYAYDTHSRLEKTRDHEGNLTSQHSYTIASGQNKIQTYLPRLAATTLGSTINQYMSSIKHFDNLGRPLQTVGLNASPDANTDIISGALTYDAFGRTARSYIPFAYAGNGSLAPLPASVHGDTKPYGFVNLYDNSPLNRPLSMFGVGEAWHMANKTTNMAYNVAAAGTIPLYTTTATGASLAGNYTQNLFKNTVIDEQGNASFEIKDLSGKIIQKAIEVSTGNYLITHYVYDDLDRLAYIIQPEGYAALQSFNETDVFFTNYVFAYHYDSRGRVVKKHVPAGGWTRFVYDKKDRKVLEQNAHQATLNRWNFMKYDVHNRVVYVGELTNTSPIAILQTAFNTHTTPDEAWSLTGGGYQDNSFPATVNTNVEAKHFNFYDSYQFTNILYTNSFFGVTVGAYDFVPHGPYSAAYINQQGLMTGSLSFNLADTQLWYVNSMYRNTKNQTIQTYQSHIKTDKNAPNRTDIIYNFVGEILTAKTKHKKTGEPDIIITDSTSLDHIGRPLKKFHGINTPASEIIRFNYDNVGRMIQKKYMPNGTFTYGGSPDYITRPPSPTVSTIDIAKRAINLNPGTEVLPNYLGYIDPNATGGFSINGLQTIDMAYHIRGGLRGINLDANSNTNPNTTEGDLFSYKLDYETAGYWDGNIGKQSWGRPNNANTEIRSYLHTYDRSSRLKSSIYTGLGTENYSLPNVSYDKNGNITNLQRFGKIGSNYGLMDDLSYVYTGNKLSTVQDDISGDHEVDFVPRGKGTYTYLANGNLLSDENKEITGIVYNSFINKPSQINLSGNRWIKLDYAGTGSLIKKEYSTGEYWEYAPEILYKNGLLHQLAHDEGRMLKNNGVFEYEFNYKDHLGNSRVSFKAEGQNLVTTDITDFDPWGITLNGLGQTNATEDRFKLQNKESLTLFGLENYVDFGARYLDKSIGRWTATDPLGSKWHIVSPYVNTMNNSIRYVDPDGREIDVRDIYRKYKNGTYVNPNLVKAFNHFANSKIGIAFLADFAKKGQVVAGHIYEQSGKFHNAKIDIDYNAEKVKHRSASGETGTEIKNGRHNIEISLKQVSQKDRVDADLETITHETFIHARRAAKDLFDNGKVDYSTGYEKYLVDHYTKLKDFSEIDHIQENRHDNTYEKYALPIILTYPNEYVKKNKKNYVFGQ